MALGAPGAAIRRLRTNRRDLGCGLLRLVVHGGVPAPGFVQPAAGAPRRRRAWRRAVRREPRQSLGRAASVDALHGMGVPARWPLLVSAHRQSLRLHLVGGRLRHDRDGGRVPADGPRSRGVFAVRARLRARRLGCGGTAPPLDLPAGPRDDPAPRERLEAQPADGARCDAGCRARPRGQPQGRRAAPPARRHRRVVRRRDRRQQPARGPFDAGTRGPSACSVMRPTRPWDGRSTSCCRQDGKSYLASSACRAGRPSLRSRRCAGARTAATWASR